MPDSLGLSGFSDMYNDTMQSVGLKSGTEQGAALGGIGGLLAGLIAGNGNIVTAILSAITGAFVGAVAGDFLKNDGPIFSPENPDLTRPKDKYIQEKSAKRLLSLDNAPGGAKAVEVDYHPAIRAELESFQVSDKRPQSNLDAAADMLADQPLLLRVGKETETRVSFTGLSMPNVKQDITFDKPVELPVNNGKVDYALATALSGMRVAGQSGVSHYIPLPSAQDIVNSHNGTLSDEERSNIVRSVGLSYMSRHGAVDRQLIQRLKDNLTDREGRLDAQFLLTNQAAFGIDERRGLAVSVNGDNLNVASGYVSVDGGALMVDKAVTIDVPKAWPHLRNGNLKNIVDVAGQRETGQLDLQMFNALNDFQDTGISYRKADHPVRIEFKRDELNKEAITSVNFNDINEAVRVITSMQAPAQSTMQGVKIPNLHSTPLRKNNQPDVTVP